MGKYILTADSSALYPLDFLAAAVLNRSLALIEGFCLLIEADNLIAAAPLLRLQVDNCIRFSAAWLVEQPHEFAMEVLRGTPIRKLRDRSKQPMTDRYLVQKLLPEAPWIESVYDQTSGYVHLSDKHIFNAMRSSEAEGIDVTLQIGSRDGFTSDEPYIEATLAFIEATQLLMKYMHGWGFTKDNPEKIAEWKRAAGCSSPSQLLRVQCLR